MLVEEDDALWWQVLHSLTVCSPSEKVRSTVCLMVKHENM